MTGHQLQISSEMWDLGRRNDLDAESQIPRGEEGRHGGQEIADGIDAGVDAVSLVNHDWISPPQDPIGFRNREESMDCSLCSNRAVANSAAR